MNQIRQHANRYEDVTQIFIFSEDTKGVIRICKSKKDRQKQWPKEKGKQ
jgi:hypothetical protein